MVRIHTDPAALVRLCGSRQAAASPRAVRPWPPVRDYRNAPRNADRHGNVHRGGECSEAGPFLGEFAYEIRYAAFLRRLVADGRKLVPCSRPGSLPLYQDFVTDFVAHDIQCQGQCWHLLKGASPPEATIQRWTPDGVERIRPCNVSPSSRAIWVPYGHRCAEWSGAVVLHARNRPFARQRNWALDNWHEAVAGIKAMGFGTIICVGTTSASRHLPGTLDMRDADLEAQMDLLASARVVVGESSGPMHLAEYCGATAVVVWCGGPERYRTAARYRNEWNPFGVPYALTAVEDWNPSVEWVVGSARKMKDCEPQELDRPPMAAPRAPRGPGAFRPSLVDVPDSGKIGVGILTHEALDDVKRNVPGLVTHAGDNCILLVYDNSAKDTIGGWLREHCPSVQYVRSEAGNVGCSNGRNRIAEILGAQGCKRIIIQDQDVGWKGDVPRAMSGALDTLPKTGIATWPLALSQMGKHKIGKGGRLDPPEAPGMCCMYDMQAIVDAGGWNADMFMYRFDSLFCLKAHYVAGYEIVAVDGENLVAHNHPHEGVKRYPWYKQEQQRSQRIFLTECARSKIPVPSGLRG